MHAGRYAKVGGCIGIGAEDERAKVGTGRKEDLKLGAQEAYDQRIGKDR